jgi:hypothetical protein
MQRRPEPEPDVRGTYYLLPEGDVSDTTQVKCEITEGPLARVRIYYEPLATVAEPILRLGEPFCRRYCEAHKGSSWFSRHFIASRSMFEWKQTTDVLLHVN